MPILNSTIFIFPLHESWDRPADFQRQTALRLAKHYPVIVLLEYQAVFWLTYLKQLIFNQTPLYPKLAGNHQNLSFSRPIYLLPGKRWPVMEKLNQQFWLWWLWLRLNFLTSNFNWRLKKVWLWLFEPNFWFYPTTVAGWNSLYDCVDDHAQTNPDLNRRIKNQETKLIQSATIFTTNSQTLARLHYQTRKVNQVVVQGFDSALWPKKLLALAKIPTNLAIFGSLDDRIDWKLVSFLIKKLPQLNLDLAGPIDPKVKTQVTKLLELPNVTYHGTLPRPKLNQLLASADICLIPYLVHQPKVKHCFPMKVLEYFAYGKPVIASPITELEFYKTDLTLARTPNDWITSIEKLLTTTILPAVRHRQRQIAWQHRYETKISQILKLMASIT